MKASIEVETVKMRCPCGYTGVVDYHELMQCPRCKEHWKITIRTNVITIEVFKEWMKRALATAAAKYQLKEPLEVDRELMKQQFRHIIEVEELMWNKPCEEWEIPKWNNCVGALVLWIKRKYVNDK